MTPEAIRNAVLASPELKTLAEAGIDNQLAALLTEQQPAVPKPGTRIGELGIYNLLGPLDGEALLQGLEAVAQSQQPVAPVIKRILRWLQSPEGVDVGNESLQGQLQALADAGAVSPASAAALIAHGSHKPPITVDEVSAALLPFRPEGRVGPINP